MLQCKEVGRYGAYWPAGYGATGGLCHEPSVSASLALRGDLKHGRFSPPLLEK